MRQDDEDVPEKQKDAAVTITISDQQLNVSEKADKPPEKPQDQGESEPGLFSLKHVKDMFSTCFKRRENNAHTIIWLVTLAGCVSIFVGDGVVTVMYLYIFGLSVVALILSSLAKGFAFLPWHLYLSVVLGVFRSIQGPMCRTIISNIVPASDTGKLLAIGNIVQ
ncbi:GL25356 [Drosophila persimilis]|uniref:GL25356 n=1 Tax=Drosophila persimilis TaxID=7234 RepID=B4HCL2_DROPE|nr:GL25356 [Drosophila persimilis]